MVTDFLAAKKARGVKFCVRVALLSRQVFSTFGEHWLAGSHGGGGISRVGRHQTRQECFPTATTVAGNWGRRRCLKMICNGFSQN